MDIEQILNDIIKLENNMIKHTGIYKPIDEIRLNPVMFNILYTQLLSKCIYFPPQLGEINYFNFHGITFVKGR